MRITFICSTAKASRNMHLEVACTFWLFNMPQWREQRAHRLLSAGNLTAASFPECGIAWTYGDTCVSLFLPPPQCMETLSQPCSNWDGIRTTINVNCREIE